MSNNLSYDLEPFAATSRIAISGPTDLMRQALDEAAINGVMPKRIRIQPLYDLRRTYNNTITTWALNAHVIGRVKDDARRDSILEGVNGFINGAVRLARGNQVQDDSEPNLVLKAYRPDGMGEFLFVADVAKPQASKVRVRGLMARTMCQMVRDLSYPQPGTSLHTSRFQANAIEEINRRTYYGEQSVTLALLDGSSVGIIDEDMIDDRRFVLDGHNVQEGAEPLIYLAGCIAMANADSLSLE